MKNLKLAIAVTSALTALASHHVMADWENLPIGGVSVGGGTSPYILCNPTGNFGSGIPTQPSSITDACAVLPSSDTTVPDSTYTGASRFPVVNRTTSIVMNNSYTNNTNITVGTLREYVWRKSTGGGNYECIYGMKVTMQNADYNLNAAGNQYFEINDMARRGWSGKTTDIAYSTVPTNASPTYRAGRTFTAVQHRPQPGYVAQPLTGANPAINGVNVWPTPAGRPTAAEQQADVNADWVNFTTDVNYLDDDGSTNPASGMQYVRASCSVSTHTTAVDAIRLRQTFQELAGDGITDNPFIEVQVEGVIPN